MDEELLFKMHNESKNPKINLNQRKKQKRTTFCQKVENGFLKEEYISFRRTLKNRHEKSIAKVIQNYDYKTNILSNISLDNDVASPFLSDIFHYSFSSDCLFSMRRSNRCAVRNRKNENTFTTNNKMLILNDKCYSGFNTIMKNNATDNIINRTLCDLQESCLTNRQSNSKRKFESDVLNELYLKLGSRNRNNSKSIIYSENFDKFFSHSKHFKSDDASQISESENKRFIIQAQFTNRIDSIKKCNIREMKNIEIQSSPVRVRVAANFGEDSIEYIDPTMEVELDTDESDPDEPGEQNATASEEPYEQNQTEDTNNGDNSASDGNASEINVINIAEEDNLTKTQSENPDTSNEDGDKNNSILNEQSLDLSAPMNTEINQTESGKDTNEEHELEKGEKIGTNNQKESVENEGREMLTPETNKIEYPIEELSVEQHEEPRTDSTKDKTVKITQMENQTKVSVKIEDTKLNELENFEELEKCVSDKEIEVGKRAEIDHIAQESEKEEIACIKGINENTASCESESTENNVICKTGEDEKETAIDIENSESVTDKISANKDGKCIEFILGTTNGEISVTEIECYNAERETEHKNEELNEIEKEQIEENLQSHFETVDNQIDNQNEELNVIEKERIEENLQSHFETGNKQIDNLKNINADENNFIEKPEKLSHPIVEQEEDSSEKDSIEDNDNYQSIIKQETEAQDLCLDLDKHDFEEGTREVIAKCIKDEYVSAAQNESAQEFDKGENLDGQENSIKNNESAKIEENDIVKDKLSLEVHGPPDAILEIADIEENVVEKNSSNTENISKRTSETKLTSEKSEVIATCDVSKNEIFDSESADENTSENKKSTKFKEGEVYDMKEKLSNEKQEENEILNIKNVDGKKEEEMSQNDKEGENTNIVESPVMDLAQDTAEQVLVNNGSNETFQEEIFLSCETTKQESTQKEVESTVCQTFTAQAVVHSSEKQKPEKPEQSLLDSVKVISPRKGIKVEEDEIETAISSIVFYDEMSDGSEQIVQTPPSALFLESTAGRDISRENIWKSEDIQRTNEEETDEIPSRNANEELPVQATTEGGELVSAEIKAQPSKSPKKRKKKRKISRSRSAQKDGPTSATKRSQDSKGSARTTRSVSSTSARSPSAGEKKLPPIKAPVGTTPPPNIKQVRSKIGSLDNVTHKPKGGDKKNICSSESEDHKSKNDKFQRDAKVTAEARIQDLSSVILTQLGQENQEIYITIEVETVKLEWNAKSKIGSLAYASHKPGGGDKKILTQKVDFKNVQSKVGSKDNLKHKPAGGNVKISTEKLDFKAKAASKVGSLENAKHKPGGGNVAIKSEKLTFKERATPKIHSRSGSERGSSHGGSETQSPVMPSSPAPPEELPPLNEDENPSSQEEIKPENPQEKAECNGAGESTQEDPSNDASETKSEVANTANDANNDNNANDGENAKEDQLIAF